jgi:hypothetical protein
MNESNECVNRKGNVDITRAGFKAISGQVKSVTFRVSVISHIVVKERNGNAFIRRQAGGKSILSVPCYEHKVENQQENEKGIKSSKQKEAETEGYEGIYRIKSR